MSNGNAFWREVIDYLPHLVLVFRIDEQDQAHLIFCNNLVTAQLGYAPKEYVLASETDDQVRSEMKGLVDEVARRSHDVEEIPIRPCTLTTKQGVERAFNIDFRIFRTKSAKTNLIVVELQEARASSGDKGDKATGMKQDMEAAPVKARQSGGTTNNWMVVEDAVMKTVWNQLHQLSDQPKLNVGFRGESGTGRRTLACKLAELRGVDPDQVVELHPDTSEAELRDMDSESGPSDLIVIELGDWSAGKQQLLKQYLKKSGSQSTRVTATLRRSLEQLVEEGAFDTELYYMLSLHPILVPPLRHRPKDVQAAARRYVVQVADTLRMEVRELPQTELQKLVRESWDGNFPQLFASLRRALLQHDEGPFRVQLPSGQKSRLFAEAEVNEDEVLEFDEMNRRYLTRILELTEGKIYGDDGAAALLDLKPTTLQSKLKKLGIK